MNQEETEMECPICSEYRPAIEHPQPFKNAEGQWQCGTCWFKHGITSLMVTAQKRPETPA